MKILFFQKKAVSPLIATVLLISFAIALGAVIINWGLNLALSDSGGCKGAKIAVKADSVCFEDSGSKTYIHFALDNTGSVDIEGLEIWMVGAKGTEYFDSDDLKIEEESSLEVKDESVPYKSETYGNLDNVQFLPKIKEDENIKACPDKAVKQKQVGAC